ncbi:hypothetical protein J1792_18940 [Streptomyces triculaminicus]|uniref:Helix-turn-helix domain-containing protein n=1 Tax=Streptomyces triculaminicus TaxID=2816232 RepID=A0A939FP98_9ACTN|nr:hypothetical protein [Streptomyces triculaminicus]MBO0654774.1 hypothetical protein [Streptomyces triculaminicus]
MLKHAIAPARFFTQVSNEIIRHPRLSAEAVRLLTWQLSLPDGVDQPLSETAKRAGIKKTAFGRAKGELKAEGYVHEWHRQGSRGRWSTTQLVSNVPLSAEEALAVRDGDRPAEPPAAVEPAVGEPEGRSVGRSQDNTEENTHNPPSQPSRLIERGALALASISHRERQLRLTGREVSGLAPLAAEWLLRGASLTDLREALTLGLPERVHSAAALVRDRLMRKMPPVPSFAEQRTVLDAPPEPRVASMRECQGDHVQPRLFRPVAGETLCSACRRERAEEAVAESVSEASPPAAARGAAAVRAALRAGEPAIVSGPPRPRRLG